MNELENLKSQTIRETEEFYRKYQIEPDKNFSKEEFLAHRSRPEDDDRETNTIRLSNSTTPMPVIL